MRTWFKNGSSALLILILFFPSQKIIKTDQWLLRNDPYLSILHADERFQQIVDEISVLNDQMYQRVLEAETSGNWQALTDVVGAI